MACQATQSSDQMVCRCGNGWDINDIDLPRCKPVAVAWIIEHRGRPPIITHYASVASSEAAKGAIVTPYTSGWKS